LPARSLPAAWQRDRRRRQERQEHRTPTCSLAPIGARVDKYLDVPESARGPAIDPAKGYRTQKLGDGLYLIADGAYQSMFMTYDDGVVVIDAPPSYAAKIPAAVAEFSSKPLTHLIYSHHHVDHIGGEEHWQEPGDHCARRNLPITEGSQRSEPSPADRHFRR
jgi:glyoxylase-like metal-dependent hydrolase (beta-lactamase superfamily II)